MSFYHLPFGHTEWRVDSRDPRRVGSPDPRLRPARSVKRVK
jgi:hypothetical protein